MASAIDATKPVAVNPTTASVRDNFATAAAEITALQAAGPYLPIAGGATTGALAVNRALPAGGNAGNIIANQSITATNFAHNAYVNTAGNAWFHLTGSGLAGMHSFDSTTGQFAWLTAPQAAAGAATATNPVALLRATGEFQVVSASGAAKLIVNSAGGTWSFNTDAVGNFALTDDLHGVVMLTAGAAGQWFSRSILPVSDNTQVLGNIGAAWNNSVAYAHTNVSGAALKTEVGPAPAALAVLNTLEPKTFRWKEGERADRINHGFLAEEVAAALGADSGAYHADDDEERGAHAIDYGQLTAVLWKAVQELAAKVETLEAAIAAR